MVERIKAEVLAPHPMLAPLIDSEMLTIVVPMATEVLNEVRGDARETYLKAIKDLVGEHVEEAMRERWSRHDDG